MIRFAVIGIGHIGRRHAEMIHRNPDTELVAVCDLLPDKAIDGARSYTSYRAMLQEEQLDVVSVCVPNGLHSEVAVAALEAGCHVVVEKPMTISTRSAQAIIDAANKAGKQVFCVMQNRYSPASVWLKELVESGKLGQIYSVQLTCFWNRDERYYHLGGWHGTKEMDGGTLYTQFSHFIDLMAWLFGDITDISARFYDFNHAGLTEFEDSGSVVFRFTDSGAAGTIQYSTAVWDKNMESTLTIIAEHGTVKVAGQYVNDVVYCHVKDYEMPVLAPSLPANDYGAYKGSAQNHHYVIQNVVDVLRPRVGSAVSAPTVFHPDGELSARTPCITTPASDGMRVVSIIERIYADVAL